MNVSEYRRLIREFTSSVGPNATVFTHVSHYESKMFTAALYPRGMGRDFSFSVEADTLADVYEALIAKWNDYREQHRAETVRKMALSIIRITAELGECTDAALRNCGEFDPGQINAYGEQACADANDIAGRGPFSIVTLAGANSETEAA